MGMWIVGLGKRSAGYSFSTRLSEFLEGKFPVNLVFAQEPALDGEWTERKEMEMNERGVEGSECREIGGDLKD